MLTLAVTVRAQCLEGQSKQLKSDSVKSDYEEWLRNEPLRQESAKPLAPHIDSKMLTRPLPPSTAIIDPRLLQPKHHPISVVIKTPKLKTDMQLAYQSHWLEEQRKGQQGGAMTIGFNPLGLLCMTIERLFPDWANRKSKKERQREQLKQVLEKY